MLTEPHSFFFFYPFNLEKNLSSISPAFVFYALIFTHKSKKTQPSSDQDVC